MPDLKRYQTKPTPPGLPEGIVLRERLFRQLDKSSKKPVVWISALGGSGKTTLVASYLQTRQVPCLWYELDDKDDDPAAFFYYLGLVLRERFPGWQEPLPLLTPEYLAGMKTFARRYFEKLFQRLPVPFTIVLDDYHDVSPVASLHELILEGLLLIPEGVTVLIISRQEPPPLFAVPETAARFAFLGWDEMRLTFPETAALARVKTGSVLNNDAMLRLHAKTDGWIAGLLLILESLGNDAGDYQLLDSLSFAEVLDYFANEIFGGNDRETQEFLLKTAFAPGLTASMAEQLTGVRRAEHILSRLARNHFFTEKRSEADPVYRYHPLFRDFLLAQAKKTFTPAEASKVTRRAALLLQQANRIEEAAELFIKAADWEGVAQLVRQAAPTLISEQGRSEVVRFWIESLPGEILEGDPDLLFWRGVCLMPINATASRHAYQKAFELFTGKNDRLGMFRSWSGAADVSIFEVEFEPMEEWVANLEILQIEGAGFPTPEIEARCVTSIFNALSFGLPHHPDIAKWEERAYKLYQSTPEANLRVQSALFLVAYYLWTGRQAKAVSIVKQVQEIPLSERLAPITLIGIKVLRTFVSIFTAEVEVGLKAAQEALQIAEETGVHIWDNHLLCHAVSLTLSRGDLAATETLLNRLLGGIKGGKRFDIGYCEYICAWKEFLQEDIPSAMERLKVALDLVSATRFRAAEGIVIHGMVEVLRTKGDLEEAGAYLAKSYAIARAMKSSYLEFVCLLDEALLAMDRRNEELALSLLCRALPLGREQGYANIHFWSPASMSRICEAALQNGIEVDYVRELVRKRNLIPAALPMHIERWPWPLRISALGAFEMKRFDAAVAPSGKAQKKPLELLKALLAFGGTNVPEDRLAAALWPDADGDYAKQSFDTTLHRLRKLLGNLTVLLVHSGCLSLDPRHCWIDVHVFEGLCIEIEEGDANGSLIDEKKIPQLEKAASLYRGHFLPADRDLPWTMRMRDRLRSRFRQIVGRAGDYWEERGQWEQAVRWYQRGIEKDGLAEEFYQRLMLCYRQQGQTVEAVRTYRRLCATLSRRLDLTPSPKTEAIYQAIVKK